MEHTTYNCYNEEFEDNGEDIMVWTDAVTSDSTPPKIGKNFNTVQMHYWISF